MIIVLEWKDLRTKRESFSFGKIKYYGPLQKINTDLLHYKIHSAFAKLAYVRDKFDALEFKERVYKQKKKFLTQIQSYRLSGEIDAKTTELLENHIILTGYAYMFYYFSYSKTKELIQKGVKEEDLIPKAYYDFIKELPLNKQSLLVNKEFGWFVNRLAYFSPLNPRSYTTNYKEWIIFSEGFLKFLESKEMGISSEEKKMMEELFTKKSYFELSDELTDKMGKYETKYDIRLSSYIDSLDSIAKKRTKKASSKNQYIEHIFDKKDSIANGLGIKNDLVYEVIKARRVGSYINSFQVENNEKEIYWESVRKDIKSPYFKKIGDDFLERSLSKSKFYEIPENEKGTNVFKKLIAPYQGKVVVVQFCNPHRYSKGNYLERIKQRRDQFKNNKDVVFLYIVDQSKVIEEEYEECIKKNGFQNSVIVSQDDYRYMRQLFEIRYSRKDILVNKEGLIVNGFRHYKMAKFLRDNLNVYPVANN